MTRAKLTAAREAGIPVIMVDRPPHPDGVQATDDVESAAAWAQGNGAACRPRPCR